jgi:hypothetical protein
MKSKIIEILKTYDEQLERYENKINNMENKLEYFTEHNFNEEYRILRVEYDSINMIVYRWRSMYNDLNELIK